MIHCCLSASASCGGTGGKLYWVESDGKRWFGCGEYGNWCCWYVDWSAISSLSACSVGSLAASKRLTRNSGLGRNSRFSRETSDVIFGFGNSQNKVLPAWSIYRYVSGWLNLALFSSMWQCSKYLILIVRLSLIVFSVESCMYSKQRNRGVSNVPIWRAILEVGAVFFRITNIVAKRAPKLTSLSGLSAYSTRRCLTP